jgi:hypothetical protein
MVTEAVVLNAAHPPDAATVYVTVYVPGVLAEGVTAPEEASMLKPAVDENEPPVVPVNVTLCAEDVDEQNGEPLYEMVAAGVGVMVTDVVVLYAAQPPAAATVYVTVYVPAVLVDGVIAPVEALIDNPAVDENVPPVVPVNVTLCGVDTDLQNGEPA